MMMIRPVFLVTVLCLVPLMVEMKNTFICERVVNVTNPDGTRGQRCSGWVRLTSSGTPQRNIPGTIQRPLNQQGGSSTQHRPLNRPLVAATTTSTTTGRPTRYNQRPPPRTTQTTSGTGTGSNQQIGVFDPSTIGDKPIQVNPVFIIDVPVNCEPGYQPDPNGHCRQTW